jgi:hypothetical protein
LRLYDRRKRNTATRTKLFEQMDLICAYPDEVDCEETSRGQIFICDYYARLRQLHSCNSSTRQCLQLMTQLVTVPSSTLPELQDIWDWQFYLQLLSTTLRHQKPDASQPERYVGKRKRESLATIMHDDEAATVWSWWLQYYQQHLSYSLCLCKTLLGTVHDSVSSLWYDYAVLHCDIWKYFLRKPPTADISVSCLLNGIHDLVQATQFLNESSVMTQLPTTRRLLDYLLSLTKFSLEVSSNEDEVRDDEKCRYWIRSVQSFNTIISPHLMQQRKSSNLRTNLYFIDGGQSDPEEELQALLVSTVVYLIYLPVHLLARFPNVLINEMTTILNLLRLLDKYGPRSEEELLKLLSRSDVVMFSCLLQLLEIDQALIRLQDTATIPESQKHTVNIVLATIRFGFTDSARLHQGLWLDSTSLFLSLCGDSVFAYDSSSILDIVAGPDTATAALSYFLLLFKSANFANMKSVANMKTTTSHSFQSTAKEVLAPSPQTQKVIIWHDQHVVSNSYSVVFQPERIESSTWISGDDSELQDSLQVPATRSQAAVAGTEEEPYSLDNLFLLVDLWEDVQDKLQESFHKGVLPFNPRSLCTRIQSFLDEATSDDVN